ncbi:ribosome small subunit-dependent GTPase A [bacterium]|nr:ribosome small subunit-dependent GTPase A [bacterium]
MNLKKYGWNDHFDGQFQQYKGNGLTAGRIIAVHRSGYDLVTENGELFGLLSGKLRFEIEFDGLPPAVGDWVVVMEYPDEGKAIIHNVLKSYSQLSRNEAGFEARQQVLACNIDTVFLVVSLNRDFSLRRIERYLVVIRNSGANAVVVLNKSDLSDEVEMKIDQVRKVAYDYEVIATSTVNGSGIDLLHGFLETGKTSVFLGSSGVGKSTLINGLCGLEVMDVCDISEYSDRGKHTTTHRQLFMTDDYGMIIDSPGMRELQLWETGNTISELFDEIEVLGRNCRFADCTHDSEPGCAVLEALENGSIDEGRLNSYFKLLREKAYMERKRDVKAKINSKKGTKYIALLQRQLKKGK